MNKLQKKMQQLENDLDLVQESLLTANNQLEEKDKALSNVSFPSPKPPPSGNPKVSLRLRTR